MRPCFEVTGSDVPTVTVVSMRKNRFATLRATFRADTIGAFLDDVLTAKQRTQMIQAWGDVDNKYSTHAVFRRRKSARHL